VIRIQEMGEVHIKPLQTRIPPGKPGGLVLVKEKSQDDETNMDGDGDWSFFGLVLFGSRPVLAE